MTRALFVTWDSPETTYLESLFFPLFAAMRPHGVAVEVLQFTWGEAVARRRAAAERFGIAYRASTVRSGGSGGTAQVLLRGPAAIRESTYDVLYPRSLVPVAIALRARPQRLVFDADGLVADERVDFAGWSPTGFRTRLFRRFERRGVQRADRVITRTARAREILLTRAGVAADRVVVIPNGKDPAVFHPGTPAERLAFRRTRGIPEDAPWALYAGSIGPQYHLEEMLAFHRHARAIRPDARLTLLTRSPLRLAQPGVEVVACGTDEVPPWLRAADVGLAWRTPTFSTAGVCPIKVAEYLLSGLPVLANRGIGDLDAQLGAESLLLDGFADLPAAAAWWLGSDREALRVAARARGLALFDLSEVARKTASIVRG